MMLYFVTSATKNREWAWKLLQYLGGRTKNGEYTQAQRLAQDAMLASGYTPVMESELLRRAWAKWAEVFTVLDVFRKATNFAEVVPAVYQPWYPRWSDAINVELTACLSGKLPADQACENLIAALAPAKARLMRGRGSARAASLCS
jgi:ABC-type glycerol-3-phosphate transport system substrate-binding protein